MMFVREVFFKILFVTPIAAILPWIFSRWMNEGFFRLVVVTIIGITSTGLSVYFMGLKSKERLLFKNLVSSKILRRK